MIKRRRYHNAVCCAVFLIDSVDGDGVIRQRRGLSVLRGRKSVVANDAQSLTGLLFMWAV